MSNISLSSLSSSEDEHLQFQAIYQFYHLSFLNSSTVVSPLFDDTIQFGQGYKLIYHLTYEDSVSESWFQKKTYTYLQIFYTLISTFLMIAWLKTESLLLIAVLFPMNLGLLLSCFNCLRRSLKPDI
jgi:hypothetical protein